MARERAKNPKYKVGDITPDEIPGLWYYAIVSDGKVVVYKQPNGLSMYMTYKNEGVAHGTLHKVQLELPDAEVFSK